jgi:hypothetical protein
MRSLMRRVLLVFLAILLTGAVSSLLPGCKQKKTASKPVRKSAPAQEQEEEKDLDLDEEW